MAVPTLDVPHGWGWGVISEVRRCAEYPAPPGHPLNTDTLHTALNSASATALGLSKPADAAFGLTRRRDLSAAYATTARPSHRFVPLELVPAIITSARLRCVRPKSAIRPLEASAAWKLDTSGASRRMCKHPSRLCLGTSVTVHAPVPWKIERHGLVEHG